MLVFFRWLILSLLFCFSFTEVFSFGVVVFLSYLVFLHVDQSFYLFLFSFLLDKWVSGNQPSAVQRIDHERVIPWYLPGVLIFVCQQNEIEDLITDHRSPTCVSECLLLSFVSLSRSSSNLLLTGGGRFFPFIFLKDFSERLEKQIMKENSWWQRNYFWWRTRRSILKEN